MNRNAKVWKKWMRMALAALLLVDAVLLVVDWRARAAAPLAKMGELEKLRRTHALLQADVRRGTNIRQGLPEVQRECDRFFRQELLEAANAYSNVVADLGEIAARAGLRASALNFKQRELEGRGVVQVEVTAAIEGDYPSLVRFINGLERSQNFYLLDSLTLASSGSSGAVRLNLQLRTYFRS